MKFYLGQRLVDYTARLFVITDLYSSDKEWIESRMTLIFELENGCIHLQGNSNNADIRKIGIVEIDGLKHTILTVDQVKNWVKKKLINFE